MDAVNVASIIVAIIAALSAYASQRSAERATATNANVTSRVEMEKEAYERARSYDTETIRRQDEELDELREDNKKLRAEVEALRKRVVRLERGITLEDLENIRERRTDHDPYPDEPSL